MNEKIDKNSKNKILIKNGTIVDAIKGKEKRLVCTLKMAE